MAVKKIKLSLETKVIFCFVILLAVTIGLGCLWLTERKSSTLKDEEITLLSQRVYAVNEAAIKKATTDSIKFAKQIDSIHVKEKQDVIHFLNEISKVNFRNNASRKRYADSLERSIGR